MTTFFKISLSIGIVGLLTAFLTGAAALLLVALSVVAPTSVAIAQSLGVVAVIAGTIGVAAVAISAMDGA